METTILGANCFPATQFPLRVMRVPSHGISHGLHKHDFTELVVILDGVGRHEVGNEIYDIGPGDVFVLLGEMSHGYRQAEKLYLINILMDIPGLGIPAADLGGLPGYHALFEVEPAMRRRGNFRNRLRLSADQLAVAVRLIAELEEEMAGAQRGSRFMATAKVSCASLLIEPCDIAPV